MSFKDGSFAQRFSALGDEAEAVFEEVWPKKFQRAGLNRPEISMINMPHFERNRPDYMDSDGYIEVMGFGKDQTFKMKYNKLHALYGWEGKWCVRIFVWDSHNKRWSVSPLDFVDYQLQHYGTKGEFNEGNKYLALKAEDWPGEWVAR